MPLTINYIREKFSNEDYKLLTSTYINSKEKLEYVCPNEHKHRTSWTNWRLGNRCPYCAKQGKPFFIDVVNSFKVEGYTLLSKEYINNRTKLEYICPVGHVSSCSFSNWKAGNRCRFCAGNVKLNINFIENKFNNENYLLLSTNYVNNKTKLSYLCPLNHQHVTTWSDWGTGYRCPTCWSIKVTGPGNSSWKGGISFEPYCEIWKDKEYKKDIFIRDNGACLNPCCNSKNSKDLTIHHINYDKKDCKLKNLITLCRSCNSKANTNREWYKLWYRAILKNRYKYSFKEK